MAKIDIVVLNNVRAFIAKLNQTGIQVVEAYIFGSYAKGLADKWSDIDVAVVSSQISDDRFEERIKLTKLAFAIDDRLEPLPFNLSNFVDDDPLVRRIKQEGFAVP